MSGELLRRLHLIADTQQTNDDSSRILAALLVGATLALSRVRETGGGYNTFGDLEKVVAELSDEDLEPNQGAQAVPVSTPDPLPAPPNAEDEVTRMSADANTLKEIPF